MIDLNDFGENLDFVERLTNVRGTAQDRDVAQAVAALVVQGREALEHARVLRSRMFLTRDGEYINSDTTKHVWVLINGTPWRCFLHEIDNGKVVVGDPRDGNEDHILMPCAEDVFLKGAAAQKNRRKK